MSDKETIGELLGSEAGKQKIAKAFSDLLKSKKSDFNLVSNELKKLASSPKALVALKSLVEFSKTLEKAKADAIYILGLARSDDVSMQIFCNQPLIDPLTVIFLIAQLDDEVAIKLEKERIQTEKSVKSKFGKLNANKRHANDPKQYEKAFVKECWDAWQANPSQYKNRTKFATAMIDKFKPENPEDESKHLCSVKSITNWCSEWEKEAKK